MIHSNVFYILTAEGFQAEKNAIPVPNKANLDLFRLGFHISDGKTGLRISQHDTEASMIATIKRIEDDAEYRNRLEEAISKALEQPDKLSPRYTRPDEKYEVLFQNAGNRHKVSKKSKERQEEQSKYETSVSNAERAIYNKQPVLNIEVRNKPVILCLFRENNISLPHKTKDWIISSLYGIQFDEKHYTWSFNHNKRMDPQFRGFFDQLVIALDRKYGGFQLQ